MPDGYEIMGRRASDQDVGRTYIVHECANELEAATWVESHAPIVLLGQKRSGYTLREHDELLNSFIAEVSYGQGEKPEEDAVEYRFNFQAQSAHIYQSLATIGAWKDGSGDPPNFHGAINVVNDGGAQRVEGVSLPIPPETFTLSYFPAASAITPSYQMLVESMVGLVNSVPYRGRPAGSLMLVRAQGGARTGGPWQLDLGWGFIANRSSIPVGDITIPAKDGLDLMWPFYEDGVDDDANALIKKPIAAYVERVFYRADPNVLGV